MIIQTIDEPTSMELVFGLVALIAQFIMIALFFGTFLYLFTIVYRFKERTEGSESLFWLRSFVVGILLVIIIYAIEGAFSLLLFSPLFYLDIPVDLLNAVNSTNIRGIIAALATTPAQVLLLFIMMIVLIVAINSYVMLGLYKVNYGWTTLLTWSAIGIFLILDVLVSFTFNEGGLAGIMTMVGDSIRNLAPS